MIERLNVGIHYDIPDNIYHADPAPEPSLSSGIARIIAQRSPLHAWHAHPRLNPAHGNGSSSDAQTSGTILHKLILGAGRDLKIIDADDYRTKDAKAQRDEAVASGRTPILLSKLGPIQEAAGAIVREIQDHADLSEMLAPGDAEVTLIWRDPKSGVMCRARVDWLPKHARSWLYDLKTTSLSAAPDDWQRKLQTDYCYQAAFYMRGARALGLRPPGMKFVVAESTAPHGISVMTAAPSLLAYADDEIERAMAMWKNCLRNNAWPGYPRATAYVEAPPWMLMRQEERALNNEAMERVA